MTLVFIYLILFVLGACFGSFWSVLLRRLNWKLTKEKINWILYGRSECPNCNRILSALDLVPIFSWLFLFGKCRWCKRKISWFYPVLELLSGFAFMSSYYFVNWYLWVIDLTIVNHLVLLIFMIVMNWVMVMFIIWDMLFYELIVPIWLGLVIFIILMQFFWIVWDFYLAVIGALMFFWAFYLIYRIGKLYVRFRFNMKDTEWFWWWDVMVAYIVWLLFPFIVKYNWVHLDQYFYIVLVYIMLSSVIWILFAIFSSIIRRWEQWQAIPFLPAMIVGFWLILFFGRFILDKIEILEF